MTDKILTAKAAAEFLTLSQKTLEALRLKGRGPMFIKLSGRRVGYWLSDLVDWANGRRFQSTSEYGLEVLPSRDAVGPADAISRDNPERAPKPNVEPLSLRDSRAHRPRSIESQRSAGA